VDRAAPNARTHHDAEPIHKTTRAPAHFPPPPEYALGMARREYVSFFAERRPDITFSERGRDPTRWVYLIVAVLAIAVSVWWFGFREANEALVTERVTGETTVPTLLTPSALESDAANASDVVLTCDSTVEEWTTFQGGYQRTGCVATRQIETPRILWNTPIGITGWRNSPVIEDGVIYVGSAGTIQYVHDRRDGIYSLDLRTGQQRWLYSTELDVNAVAVRDGIVVALGDEGRVWVLRDEGAQGDLIWLDDLDVGSFADPVFIGDDVIIAAGDGRVFAYDVDGGRNTRREFPLTLEGAIRGGLSTDGERIYAASDTGHVVAFTPDRQIAWQRQLNVSGAADLGVFAAPTISGEQLILSIAAGDGPSEPGLVALDRRTGEDLWTARDNASLKLTGWSNLRSSPAVAGEYVVFGEAFSQGLVVVDKASGETLWSADAGGDCYWHWPSPIVNTTAEGGAVAYLARHDGGLYGIDLQTQELVWSIYLGDVDGDGRTGAFPPTYEDSDFCQWGPEDGNSIFGSPAIAPDGTVVVGTGEGYIVAVGDPGD